MLTFQRSFIADLKSLLKPTWYLFGYLRDLWHHKSVLRADPRKSTLIYCTKHSPGLETSEAIINQSTNQIEWKNITNTFYFRFAKTFFLPKNHVKKNFMKYQKWLIKFRPKSRRTTVQSVCFSTAKLSLQISSNRIASHGPLIQLDWQLSWILSVIFITFQSWGFAYFSSHQPHRKARAKSLRLAQ